MESIIDNQIQDWENKLSETAASKTLDLIALKESFCKWKKEVFGFSKTKELGRAPYDRDKMLEEIHKLKGEEGVKLSLFVGREAEQDLPNEHEKERWVSFNISEINGVSKNRLHLKGDMNSVEDFGLEEVFDTIVVDYSTMKFYSSSLPFAVAFGRFLKKKPTSSLIFEGSYGSITLADEVSHKILLSYKNPCFPESYYEQDFVNKQKDYIQKSRQFSQDYFKIYFEHVESKKTAFPYNDNEGVFRNSI